MKFAVGSLVHLLVLATTSVVTVNAMATTNGSCPPCPPCGSGSFQAPPWPPAAQTKPKTIVVGGDKQNKWEFGYNYSDWAIKYAMQQPFFVGDTLEFIYVNHTVVLLPDKKSYDSCDLSKATLVGSINAGVKGFNYTLVAKKQNEDPFHYFACNLHDGIHCGSMGMMKFFVYAWPRFNK